MYNAHRGMLPQHAPPQNRIAELLDQVRAEFEANAGRAADQYGQERERMLTQQAHEMQDIHNHVRELERQTVQMKADYERQIAELTRELERRQGAPPPLHGAASGSHPVHAAPPAIGQGPRELFGQIMSGGGQQGSLAPPPSQPTQQPGLPAHLTQGMGSHTGPQPPQHQPYPEYAASGVNGYPAGPPPATSPGPGRRGQQGGPHPPPHGSGAPPPQAPAGAPASGAAGSAASSGAGPGPAAANQNIPNYGNDLMRYNPDELPQQFVKNGEDWGAIFNPHVPRRLDVNLIHSLPHNSVVCCVRFSADGRYIATGCNRSAQIFDVERGHSVAVLEDESARGVDDKQDGDLYIRSVCFSPDGKYLATGAEDKVIRVWDIANKEIVQTFTGHEQDIYSLDYSRNGKFLASGSGDKTVKIWNLERKEPGYTFTIEEGVTTVALSPDGRLVAAGSLDRSVRVWDALEGYRIADLDSRDGHTDSVYSVAFSPSGTQLVSGSLDKKIKMWELPSPSSRSSGGQLPKGRCIRTFEGHGDFVLSVALTHDAQWVLSGSKDRGVVFWDPKTGAPQVHLQGHRNSVISVAPSPRGGVFATGSGDARCRVWSYTHV